MNNPNTPEPDHQPGILNMASRVHGDTGCFAAIGCHDLPNRYSAVCLPTGAITVWTMAFLAVIVGSWAGQKNLV